MNRFTSQWSHESEYTDAVRAPVESFTIRTEPGEAGGVLLVLEWEKTRVPIPLSPAS